MTNQRVPAEAFPPGDSIREELEEREWSQADLADILGETPAFVNEILSGKRGITPETALGLSEALGGSPQYWLNLEASYQLWLKRNRGGK
jgi:HTH-type transcriptional regulator/antitoxin HigA